MTPRVSIILPVCDAALTLRRAIRSCLTQTLTAFELLVIDDGHDAILLLDHQIEHSLTERNADRVL